MSLTPNTWERFRAEAHRLGLKLVLTSPIASLASAPGDPLFDAVREHTVPPGATHAIVLLQTGGAYWEHLENLRRKDPGLDAHADPLDTMSRRLSHRLAALLGEACVGVHFPFDSSLNFVALGQRMGAGAPSRLSILIHPTYGPWIAFRMLFYVRDPQGVLPATAPIAVSACDGCPAPCIPSCPAGALVGPSGSEKLDYPASFRFRKEHAGVCVDACAARLACPVGEEYRYPAAFLAHSHRRAFAVGMAYLGDKQGRGTTVKAPDQGRLF